MKESKTILEWEKENNELKKNVHKAIYEYIKHTSNFPMVLDSFILKELKQMALSSIMDVFYEKGKEDK